VQITLNVEGSQLDSEVKALLASLSEEQKKELALNMLSKSLDNTNSELMLGVAKERVAEEYNKDRAEKDHVMWSDLKKDWFKKGYNGLWDINVGYGEREHLYKAVQSKCQAHAFFKEDVLRQMVRTAQSEVETLVKTSPVIAEAIESAKKTIQENLPKMVHDAVIMYFCSQMESMSRSIAATMFQSGQQDQLLAELQKRLS
jgi:hypothetical protein